MTITPEIVTAVFVGVGGLLTIAMTQMLSHSKQAAKDREASAEAAAEAAKDARKDRQQFQNFVQALVTQPKGSDGTPTNGRTRLLVEQTHGMTEGMEKSFSVLELQACKQTKCIKAMSEQMGRMNRNDNARIELLKQILERERVVCLHAEFLESDKGHDI